MADGFGELINPGAPDSRPPTFTDGTPAPTGQDVQPQTIEFAGTTVNANELDPDLFPKVSPPASPEEKAQRAAEYKGFFDRLAEDPGLQALFFTFGTELLRSYDPQTQTRGDVVANALQRGVAQKAQVDQTQFAQQQERAKLGLEERRVSATEAQTAEQARSNRAREQIQGRQVDVSEGQLTERRRSNLVAEDQRWQQLNNESEQLAISARNAATQEEANRLTERRVALEEEKAEREADLAGLEKEDKKALISYRKALAENQLAQAQQAREGDANATADERNIDNLAQHFERRGMDPIEAEAKAINIVVGLEPNVAQMVPSMFGSLLSNLPIGTQLTGDLISNLSVQAVNAAKAAARELNAAEGSAREVDPARAEAEAALEALIENGQVPKGSTLQSDQQGGFYVVGPDKQVLGRPKRAQPEGQ